MSQPIEESQQGGVGPVHASSEGQLHVKIMADHRPSHQCPDTYASRRSRLVDSPPELVSRRFIREDTTKRPNLLFQLYDALQVFCSLLLKHFLLIVLSLQCFDLLLQEGFFAESDQTESKTPGTPKKKTPVAKAAATTIRVTA